MRRRDGDGRTTGYWCGKDRMVRHRDGDGGTTIPVPTAHGGDERGRSPGGG